MPVRGRAEDEACPQFNWLGSFVAIDHPAQSVTRRWDGTRGNATTGRACKGKEVDFLRRRVVESTRGKPAPDVSAR